MRVDRLARKGSVEIDHMEPARARERKARSLFAGIVAVHGRAVHIAFGEADDIAALEIDGGEDDHAAAPSPIAARLLPCGRG